jgi:phage shock protein A
MDTITAAHDNFLSRVGRLIAGIAYDAIEQAEGKNKLKVVSQAIREIESAENEAREALAAARVEEYRLNARRSEIEREMTDLAGKIQGAIDDSRDDLARAGLARQMDLEAQFKVLSRAIDENNEKIEQCVTSLRAVLSALQDAEQRRADLEKSEAAAGVPSTSTARKQGGTSAAAKALRAGRAVARATGVPAGIPFSSDIDELSTLHRDKEIAARLARLKSRS